MQNGHHQSDDSASAKLFLVKSGLAKMLKGGVIMGNFKIIP